MKTEKLISTYLKINDDDCWSVIGFYENNNQYFKNFDQYFHLKDFENLTLILNSYIEALREIGKYTKALDNYRNFEILIQNLKDKKSKYHVNYNQKFLFYQGDFHFKLREYKKAKQIFQKLIKLFPENRNFQKQFVDIKLRINDHLYTRIEVIFIMIYLFGFFCEEFKILNGLISYGIQMFGIIAFFSNMATHHFTSFLIKKRQLNE